MLGTFSLRFTQITALGKGCPEGARLRLRFLPPPGCTEDKIETLKKKKKKERIFMSAACSRSPKALTQVLLANRITRWDNTNDLSLCPRPRLRGVRAASGAGRISPAAPPRLLKRWAARLESQKALFFWGWVSRRCRKWDCSTPPVRNATSVRCACVPGTVPVSLAAPEQGFLPKPLLLPLLDPRRFLPLLLVGSEPREASEGT